jgi:hypothetical protein
VLYHFSEEEHIVIFNPRKHPSFPDRPPMVWAIDKDRSPLYFFPRNCPRIAFWATAQSSQKDREHFLSGSPFQKVIAIEGAWFTRIQQTMLYRYSFQTGHFKLFDEGAGYYVSYETESPLQVEPVGSLLQALIDEGVELRIVPSLRPLYEKLPKTSLHFSMIRMRNAKFFAGNEG